MNIAETLIAQWTAPNPTLTKAEYLTKLQSGVWVVEFTKVDGTSTTMEVTLDTKLTPPLKENTQPRAEQDHLIHAYSVDRIGWRSFTVANVKTFYRKPENF